MDNVLGFFSDLILITAGIIVCLMWLALIGIITIESWDFFTGYDKKKDEEEDRYP